MTATARLGLPLIVLALAAAAPAPEGRTIVDHGSGGGAPPCSSCHGAKLEGNPALPAPAIAGLPAAKIVARLDHYASPEGHNAMMKAVATALSSSERAAVAAYITGLPKAPASAYLQAKNK